jgi:hypothetical protein
MDHFMEIVYFSPGEQRISLASQLKKNNIIKSFYREITL